MLFEVGRWSQKSFKSRGAVTSTTDYNQALLYSELLKLWVTFDPEWFFCLNNLFNHPPNQRIGSKRWDGKFPKCTLIRPTGLKPSLSYRFLKYNYPPIQSFYIWVAFDVNLPLGSLSHKKTPLKIEKQPKIDFNVCLNIKVNENSISFNFLIFFWRN